MAENIARKCNALAALRKVPWQLKYSNVFRYPQRVPILVFSILISKYMGIVLAKYLPLVNVVLIIHF